MSGIDLSVIIVNWNSADYVMACVESLDAQKLSISYEVLVVDNASYDACARSLARKYPDVVFIQSNRNLGFAGANNLAAARARGDVLLFLNPDTIVGDHAIAHLHAEIQAISEIGILGCRLLNTDHTLQTSCVQAFPTPLNQFMDADLLARLGGGVLSRGPRAVFGTERLVEVEAVSGACMMIRKEIFQKVGGFCEDFFMYGEDIDLCFRVARAGKHNYYLSSAEIVHHGGGSSQQTRSDFSIVMMRESIDLLLRRTRGERSADVYRVAMMVAAALRLMMLLILAPAWMLRWSIKSWTSVWHKWQTILRWAVGFAKATRPGLPVDDHSTASAVGL